MNSRSLRYAIMLSSTYARGERKGAGREGDATVGKPAQRRKHS
jgi:hypothetical protein